MHLGANVSVSHQRFAHEDRTCAAAGQALDIGSGVNAAFGDEEGRGAGVEG